MTVYCIIQHLKDCGYVRLANSFSLLKRWVGPIDDVYSAYIENCIRDIPAYLAYEAPEVPEMLFIEMEILISAMNDNEEIDLATRALAHRANPIRV